MTPLIIACLTPFVIVFLILEILAHNQTRAILAKLKEEIRKERIDRESLILNLQTDNSKLFAIVQNMKQP